MSIKKILKVFALAIVLSISVVSISCSDIGNVEESFKIENEEKQRLLIHKLKQKRVEIRVDKDQRVWFSPKDRRLVHDLAGEIMSSLELEPDTIVFHYEDLKYTDILEDKLMTENAPFEIEIINGVKNIKLRRKDKHLWQDIIKQVDDIVVEEKMRRLTEH